MEVVAPSCSRCQKQLLGLWPGQCSCSSSNAQAPELPSSALHPSSASSSPSSSTPGSSDRIMKSCTIYYKKAIRETAGLGTAPVTQLIALGISGWQGRKRHCCQDLVSGSGGEEGAVGCSTACWSVPSLGVSLLRVFRAHQQQKAQSENSDVEPHQLLLGLCSGAVAESTVQCSRQRQPH